jgi:hypothetical protein
MCKPYLGLINNINYKSPFIVKTFQDETIMNRPYAKSISVLS